MAIADGVVRAGRGHCKNLKMSQQEIGDFTIKLVLYVVDSSTSRMHND